MFCMGSQTVPSRMRASGVCDENSHLLGLWCGNKKVQCAARMLRSCCAHAASLQAVVVLCWRALLTWLHHACSSCRAVSVAHQFLQPLAAPATHSAQSACCLLHTTHAAAVPAVSPWRFGWWARKSQFTTSTLRSLAGIMSSQCCHLTHTGPWPGRVLNLTITGKTCVGL